MCGIAGFISFSENPTRFLKSALILQHHRGPDSTNYVVDKNIGVCHSRLSIIDIESGKQPMEFNNYVIVFNGEIYNYKEIRNLLKSKGIEFNTNSDTEVVLKGYAYYGKEILDKLRGMFAFCIWNKRKNTFFLARDRFGIKPLHYFYNAKIGFAFSSEINPLINYFKENTSISADAIDTYLTLQYIPSPYTAYNDIRKLEAGAWLEVNSSQITRKGFYFNIYSYKPPLINFTSYCEAKEVTNEILANSVQSHMIADVEVGTFLSGGIDSTLVTQYASSFSPGKINTFSIGFNESQYDESSYADFASQLLGTKHHKYIVEKLNVEDLKLIASAYGEPFGDSSSVPTYFVSKLAGKDLKVCLTGDGADELFFGYDRYFGWLNKTKRYQDISQIKKMYVKLGRKISPQRYGSLPDEPNFERWLSTVEFFKEEDKKRLWISKPAENKILVSINEKYNKLNGSIMGVARKMEIALYLNNDILTKVDVAAMQNSLETRTPFIDKEVLDIALSLPEDYLYLVDYEKSTYRGKTILKDILGNTFPNDFIDRKKMGFSMPLDKWLFGHGDLRDYILSEFADSNNMLYEFLDKKEVHEVVDGKKQSNVGRSGQLWLLIMLSEWLKNTTK